MNNDHSRTKQLVDCIVLCGGYSNRLHPLTKNYPKALLPVAGRPALQYVLNFILESKLVNNVFISINQQYALEFEKFINSSFEHPKKKSIKINIEPSCAKGNKLGPVKALNFIIPELETSDLLILGGDNLFEFSLEEFLNFALKKQRCTNAVYGFNKNFKTRGYGIAHVQEGNIIQIDEKPNISNSREVSTACYYLKSSDIEDITAYLNSGGDSDSLGGLFNWLISSKGPLSAFTFSSLWFDIGTRQRLLEANWHYLIPSLEGRVCRNTTVAEPVQLENNSHVKNSRLGPNVYIASGVRVVNSEISNSILLKGSYVKDSYIKDCVIGFKSHVQGSFIREVLS